MDWEEYNRKHGNSPSKRSGHREYGTGQDPAPPVITLSGEVLTPVPQESSERLGVAGTMMTVHNEVDPAEVRIANSTVLKGRRGARLAVHRAYRANGRTYAVIWEKLAGTGCQDQFYVIEVLGIEVTTSKGFDGCADIAEVRALENGILIKTMHIGASGPKQYRYTNGVARVLTVSH